jgi:tetratricopeptide (TPR) repeat protein
MVHNGYLQLAVTNGVPGLLLYLALVVSILRLLWRTNRTSPETVPGLDASRHCMVGWAFVGSIAGYLVQDLSGWEEISLGVFLWTILGAAVAFCGAASTLQPRTGRAAGWRVAGSVVAVAAVVGVAGLAVATFREWRADALLFESNAADVTGDWPRVQQNLTTALQLMRDDSYYADAAGVRYLQRLNATGERDAYERAVILLDRARRRNPFDPYILIHRIDLEATGLQRKVVAHSSAEANRAVDTLLAMDGNNARAHAAPARLRLVEGRPQEALASIRRSEALRPNEPAYCALEGDVLRALGDKPGQIAAYQRAASSATIATVEWPRVEQKLILALIEAGRHEAAAAEARSVIARLPGDSVAHTLLGIAYLRMDAPALAKESFTRALEIDPVAGGAREGLLEAEQLVGNRRAPRD